MATKAKKVAEKETLPKNDKKAALETVMQRIERECGKGSIMRLGESSAMNVSAVSTGSLSLDFALGIGGIPRGRITEIYGPESSGKTTVALHIVAEDSGPKISIILPRGTPPIPSATSSAIEPVLTA